jgi:hypothetical protein
MILHGTGCCLLDFLYAPVDFTSPAFKALLSRTEGDRGLNPGRLVLQKILRCERVLDSPDSSQECKAELRRALYNPVELNRRLNEGVEKRLKLNREKGYSENAPCQGGGQAPAA